MQNPLILKVLVIESTSSENFLGIEIDSTLLLKNINELYKKGNLKLHSRCAEFTGTEKDV